jgi:hypothetical protein
LIDKPGGEFSQDSGEGGGVSPETLLETLGAQASEAALFPGSLREEFFFSYDLLLDQSTVSRFVKGMTVAHICVLRNHRLVWPYFYPPAGSCLPGLLRTNQDEDCVWGVLYRTAGKDLRALESYLRIPNRYHRRGVATMDRGGRRMAAFTYVLTLHDPVMGKPSKEYLERLVACATERGLPDEWLANLKALPVGEYSAMQDGIAVQ